MHVHIPMCLNIFNKTINSVFKEINHVLFYQNAVADFYLLVCKGLLNQVKLKSYQRHIAQVTGHYLLILRSAA